MKRVTIRRDPVESPFSPALLSEADYQRCSKLLNWRTSPRTGKTEVFRKSPHLAGRVAANEHVFSVLPELSARDFVDYLIYATGGKFDRFHSELATSIQAEFVPEDDEFTELLCYVMIKQAEQLSKAGLARTYQPHRASLYTVRGRPHWTSNFGRRVIDGLVCDFHQITSDNKFNRLVLAGLEQAKRLLRRRPTPLEPLLFAFRSSATYRPPTQAEFKEAQLRLSRLTESYRPALITARTLIFGFTAEDILDGSNASLQCLQFDMAILFERFLTRLLSEALASTHICVLDQQDDGEAILDGFEQSYMRIRPDLVLFNQEKPLVVADAKFKTRYVSEPMSKVTSEDIYQMFLYGNRFLSKYELDKDEIELAIFSPVFEEPRTVADGRALTIRWNKEGERRLTMYVVPVRLPSIVGLLRRGRSATEAIAASAELQIFLERTKARLVA